VPSFMEYMAGAAAFLCLLSLRSDASASQYTLSQIGHSVSFPLTGCHFISIRVLDVGR
jgi:hypothetical protein